MQRKETQRALEVSLAAEKEEAGKCISRMEFITNTIALQARFRNFFLEHSVTRSQRKGQVSKGASRFPFNMAKLPKDEAFTLTQAFPPGLPEQSLVNI